VIGFALNTSVALPLTGYWPPWLAIPTIDITLSPGIGRRYLGSEWFFFGGEEEREPGTPVHALPPPPYKAQAPVIPLTFPRATGLVRRRPRLNWTPSSLDFSGPSKGRIVHFPCLFFLRQQTPPPRTTPHHQPFFGPEERRGGRESRHIEFLDAEKERFGTRRELRWKNEREGDPCFPPFFSRFFRSPCSTIPWHLPPAKAFLSFDKPPGALARRDWQRLGEEAWDFRGERMLQENPGVGSGVFRGRFC